MVEISQSELNGAANAIDALFEAAFGSRDMGVSEMRTALETADNLRNQFDNQPSNRTYLPGDTVYDKNGGGCPLTVVGTLYELAWSVRLPNGETVAEYNDCNGTEKVVAVRYDNGAQTYYFPESRLRRPVEENE